MSKRILIAAVALASAFATVPARAVDGCKVLLCLAGPWQSISQCVAPVEQLFSDLWNGRPFPSCNMASAHGATTASSPLGGSSSAGNTMIAGWSTAPHPGCPPQYVIQPMRRFYTCRYTGVIRVTVNGAPWSSTYWSQTGASVTNFSAAAQAQNMAQDPRWLADLAAYQAARASAAAARLSGL
jgi:hypothetical protein